MPKKAETAASAAAPKRRREMPSISIVIPVHNEAPNLPLLFSRLTAVAEGLERSVEIIFTDDGSTDNSCDLLVDFHKERPSLVRVIEFDRNYGQQMATIAGFEKSRGAVIVTLDADLQNPPEEIPKLLALIDEGHDVVGGYRHDRQDSILRRTLSRIGNRAREATTSIKLRDQGCMLRAYKRDIIERIIKTGETSIFIPALAQHFAQNPTEIPVAHARRHAGKSNYNLYKLIRLNFDLMTGFSLLPLQIFTISGVVISGFSLLLVFYLAMRRIFIGSEVEGIFTLFGITFFLLGVMILGLGIVGEYVGRIYLQVRDRGRGRFHIKKMYEDTRE